MNPLRIQTLKPLIEWVRRNPTWVLSLLLCLLLLPWLGMTPFNTKGEPREAIVAVSMLQSGNWVLPLSFGADIPYKPPFLAWCIAAVSALGGAVTPFTSRLPSALAAIGLALITYRTVRRSATEAAAFTTAMVLVTSLEVWRAAAACRVDMVLTFFMVAALYTLYKYINRGMHGVPWLAVACMTCAVLTKGPVGMLLPCLVAWVYALIRGVRFWRAFGLLAAAGVMALMVPAAWYVAAAQMGGERFIDLAMEENFGRFTGTMSYQSHEKPVWYNFIMLLGGMLPYTLLALLALFTVRRQSGPWSLRRVWASVRAMEPWRLFALVSAVVIFTFYCIPKSKRGVYLLPVYPMLAYFVTLLMLRARSIGALRIFAVVMASVAIILPLGLWSAGAVWGAGIEHMLGRSATMVHALCAASTSIAGLLTLTLTLTSGVYLLQSSRLRPQRVRSSALATIYSLLLTASASLLPPVLATKSDAPLADELQKLVPEGEPVFEYLSDPSMRYFTINFYMSDRLRLFGHDAPESGYMLTSQNEVEKWQELYGDKFDSAVLHNFDHRSCDSRETVALMRFWRR